MSTPNDALAQVYARSLFDLASQAGGPDKILEVADELEQIAELGRSQPTFAEFLNSPIIDADRRGKSLRSMFENRITDLTLRFLLVLNDKERLGHLGPITEAFDSMVHESFGKVEVDLFTPAPPGDQLLNAVRNRLQQSLGKEPIIHTYTDPTMIGGIKLRIGDQLIDGSIATRLQTMKQELLEKGASQVRAKAQQFIQEE